MMPTSAHPTDSAAGFSLVEVLVSVVLLGLLAAMLGQILQGAFRLHTLQSGQPLQRHEREGELARQLAGESETPVLELRLREDAE
jgi:prepilin-type N-terminal cleavage/methylation domain-containing protein